jgi:hypothetical protein
VTETPDTTKPGDPGRVLLRLPRGLHEDLRATAGDQGVSLNTLLVTLLAGGIGWTPAESGRPDSERSDSERSDSEPSQKAQPAQKPQRARSGQLRATTDREKR